MVKTCSCGAQMEIRLRTVIYSRSVEIANVPVFQCDACRRSEVHDRVKPALTKLIRSLGARPPKCSLAFEDFHEFAYLLKAATDRELRGIPVERLVEDRINQILDLMLLAKSLNDESWLDECRQRLQQISGETMHIV